MLDRREFISRGIHLILGGVAFLALPGCCEEKPEVKHLKRLISKKSFGPVININSLKGQPMSELIENIFYNPIPKNKKEVFQQLNFRIKSDFESGNTVIVDGWVFSKTALNFSLLQTLI